MLPGPGADGQTSFFFSRPAFDLEMFHLENHQGLDFQSNCHSYLGSDSSINAASYFPVLNF